MSAVIALIPDLLFGSNVIGALSASGMQAELVDSTDGLGDRLQRGDLAIVDLTGELDAASVIAALPAGVRTLAFYSHVDAEARRHAEELGFEVVVPRSRMAREGAQLVRQMLAR